MSPIESAQLDVAGLRAELAAERARSQRLAGELAAVERRFSELCRVAVVLRLHESTARGELVDAIREVVINLVGTEDFALYERSGDRLLRVVSDGPCTDTPAELPLHGSVAGEALAAGRVLVRGDGPASDPAACVPLWAGDILSGALVISSLLPHRGALTSDDLSLLELLGRHLGTALLACRPAAGAMGAAA